MRAETKLGAATLARPFLGLNKAALVALCEAHGWPYLDDPSNADPLSRGELGPSHVQDAG